MFDALPVVHGPWFCAVAVPAVPLGSMSKSGFARGFARGLASGCGALAMPTVALTLPVQQAAAIMLPLWLVMDATGLQRLWVGVWLGCRSNPAWFYRLAYAGMALTGCMLLWDGLRP